MREYDYTMLSTFLCCRRKYMYRMIHHLDSKAPKTAPEFGRCIHKALDSWYKDKDVTKAKAVFDSSFVENPEDSKRSKAVGFKIIEGYHEQYQDQPMTLIASEKDFTYELAPGINYMGRLDKIVNWDGAVFVMDHKTTSRLNREYFRMSNPNMQFDGYMLAAQKLGHKCAGVVVDAILVAKGLLSAKDRAKLTPLARHIEPVKSADALFKSEQRALAIIRDIEHCTGEGDFYMNTDNCCMWNTTCPYYKLCTETDADIVKQITESDYDVKPWEPRKLSGDSTED